MKKPPKMFTVEVHPPGRPGKACIGVECGQVLSINLIPNRTGKEPMTYSARLKRFTRHSNAGTSRNTPLAASDGR